MSANIFTGGFIGHQPDFANPSGVYGVGPNGLAPFQPKPQVFDATGGTKTTITDGGVTFNVHTFTGTGIFEPVNNGFIANVEYLVIAGGGASGKNAGAGGGAEPRWLGGDPSQSGVGCRTRH